jgi:uncharacterized glyoxalase superfamily protein PhnB
MQNGDGEGTDQERRHGPDRFRARALQASLTQDDLEESLVWYRDVVGFHVADEHRGEDGGLRAVMLKAGAVDLIINQDDGGKGWDRSKGEGISLYLTTALDVDEVARGIEERGGALAAGPADMPWGARTIELRDPTGFKLIVASES